MLLGSKIISRAAIPTVAIVVSALSLVEESKCSGEDHVPSPNFKWAHQLGACCFSHLSGLH
jgi:hypothetical protein